MLSELKQQLEDKGVSIREVARQLKINHSIVVSVLQGKYKGSEKTKERVIERIKLIVASEGDFNTIINSKLELFEKLSRHAFKPQKFSDQEADDILDFLNELRFVKKLRNENEEEKNPEASSEFETAA